MWSDKDMLEKVEAEGRKDGEAGRSGPYRFGQAQEKFAERKSAEEMAEKVLVPKPTLLGLVEDGTVMRMANERLPKVAEVFEKQKTKTPSTREERGANLEIALFGAIARGVVDVCKAEGVENMIDLEAALAIALGRYVSELLAVTCEAAIDMEKVEAIGQSLEADAVTAILREATELAAGAMHKTGCSMLKVAHEKFHEHMDELPGRIRAAEEDDGRGSEFEVSFG